MQGGSGAKKHKQGRQAYRPSKYATDMKDLAQLPPASWNSGPYTGPDIVHRKQNKILSKAESVLASTYCQY